MNAITGLACFLLAAVTLYDMRYEWYDNRYEWRLGARLTVGLLAASAVFYTFVGARFLTLT